MVKWYIMWEAIITILMIKLSIKARNLRIRLNLLSAVFSYFLATKNNLWRIIAIIAIPTKSLKGDGKDRFGQ